ncbi:type II DNA modification enzyme [bacterium]|nr:type II DNA modification enzyme [Chloroflexi bacterium CFX6]RIL10830.1 MAG: type II DNA modification enzyme [bacterium]
MHVATRSGYTTIATEGAILPAELLQRIAEGADLPGLRPEDYHLAPRERLNEAINRSWNRCLAVWRGFDELRGTLPAAEAGTTETRDRWLLILFQELGYGRLRFAGGVDVEGARYPISHVWGATPIHLVTFRQDLDRRGEVIGARTASPHSLVQELLNRSPDALWGMVSNGLRLRLLRDNVSLTRAAFVEFDLEAMMAGEVYSDFALLWLLCHQSRVEAEPQSDCWLERWSLAASEHGVRALEVLRDGVRDAIAALGTGFLAHGANGALRDRLRGGGLAVEDFYRQLLRLAYRLIFVFVAEDRDLLLLPGAPEAARAGYLAHYSTRRLRELAAASRGGAHGDLYRAQRLVFGLLDGGYEALALPGLGGLLFGDRAAPDLDGAELANRHFLDAVRALAFVVEGRVRRPVDYRNLGAEEMGSVYESLLELRPVLDVGAGSFALRVVAGSERKTTGSHYTPASLIQCVLDGALEPVVADRLAAARGEGRSAEEALLGIRVLDSACGSGHFLIGAAHRLARHLARARTGDDEPSPDARRNALRDVVRHCIHGVDLNETALELCKVALWMESLEPGKPLGFLDANIQCGNSLLGATPRLLAEGIPDGAFAPIEGDDRGVCSEFRKLNKLQRAGQLSLFGRDFTPWDRLGNLAAAMAALDDAPDDSVAAVRAKETRYADLVRGSDYRYGRFLADTWCAAFVWVKSGAGPQPITEEVFRRIERNPHAVERGLEEEVRRLAAQYRFFHWHLAFPQVFRMPAPGAAAENAQAGWNGGFDVVVGNPPWEAMSPDAKEFFATYDPEVRFQDKAGQDRIVEELLASPEIAAAWERYRRSLYAEVHFIKDSGAYRLFAPGNLGKGDFNLYRFFVEGALQSVRSGGCVSQIVPEGLYNGANCMAIREELFEGWELTGLLGFENAREIWFTGIDSRTKFCIYAARRPGPTTTFPAAFNIRDQVGLSQAMRGGALAMPVTLVREFSPDALAVMEFGSQIDIDIAAKMYACWPKFGDETAGPPHRQYMAEVHMGNDRHLFTEAPTGLPVYEGRMVAQYDHRAKGYRSGRGRAADWEDLSMGDPGKSIQPQWYLPVARIPTKVRERAQRYRIGFCDVASPTNERSLVAALLPPGVVAGDKVPTIVFERDADWAYLVWLAVANSFSMDFLARKKISLKMSYTVLDSLPLPRLTKSHPCVPLLVPEALRLTCTSAEMLDYWNAMAAESWVLPADAGNAPPGLVDEDERLLARAKIEAIVARDLFGITREELAYVLDTFPIVRRKDEAAHGEYRTKRVILEMYDQMAAAALRPNLE